MSGDDGGGDAPAAMGRQADDSVPYAAGCVRWAVWMIIMPHPMQGGAKLKKTTTKEPANELAGKVVDDGPPKKKPAAPPPPASGTAKGSKKGKKGKSGDDGSGDAPAKPMTEFQKRQAALAGLFG